MIYLDHAATTPLLPEAAEAMARAHAVERNGEQITAMADRFALVWQIADEEPYLKLLGRLAPLAGGELEQEQGFRGVRIPGVAAAYVGRGHLVLAVGEGTLEKVLAAIRTPFHSATITALMTVSSR